MSFIRVPAWLLLALLAGCTAAEQIALSIAPGPLREWHIRPLPKERPTELAPDVRAEPKTEKAAWPQPIVTRAPEAVLPPWTIPSQKPPPLARNSLTAGELFRELSSSVYTVAVPNSQGSAVAISSRELVTNCHVVAFAKVVTLINGDRTLSADVVSADQATDRCFLRIQSGELKSVPGVREYSSLTVGEGVYTIGSPRGLINTLGSGLLSGLRISDDGIEYIQVSAPLSDGSSGGGLFDDRGNLIGVTTFTIRDSQPHRNFGNELPATGPDG